MSYYDSNQRESSQETKEDEGRNPSVHQVLLHIVPQASAVSLVHICLPGTKKDQELPMITFSLFQGTLWLMGKQAVFLNYLTDFLRLEKCLRNLKIIWVTLTVTLAHTTEPLKGLEYATLKYGPWPLKSGRLRKVISSCKFCFPHFARSRPYKCIQEDIKQVKRSSFQGVLPSSEKGPSHCRKMDT